MKWKDTASCMWELEEKCPAMLCGFEQELKTYERAPLKTVGGSQS
jgi:hypothetical protein